MINFRIRKIYIALIFIFVLFTPNQSSSEEIFNKKQTKKEFSGKTYDPTNLTEYLLGAGDVLDINFIGIDIFSNQYPINPDGYIELPEIKPLYANKMTLKELKNKLIEKYREYIIRPDIKLYISKYRPINLVVNGEVKQPGLYTLDFGEKVFDALKLTNGISNNADLSNIKITRNDSLSNGGGKIATNLNFLSLLKDGDQDVNIRIMDGDIINIPRSNKPIKDQILSLNKSNITPDKITVYISGNIAAPGEYSIQQGSSLIQAIYKAGGQNYFTGTVNHLRFYSNGKKEKTNLTLDLNSKNNRRNNPILLNGDIIHVNKNIFGKTTKALGEIITPVIQTQLLLDIFD